MSKFRIQKARGMYDILPEDQKYFRFLESNFFKIASLSGFSKIDTPIVERDSLFTRSVGEETDIVRKEMFALESKKSDNEVDEKDILVLRPEATASIVRAYIEYGMQSLPQPVQLYYFGPMFRYDRPQKGRSRQFYQAGLEILGDLDPILDAQLISLAFRFLKEIRIDSFSIQINSIGCLKCRQKFVKKLKEYYKPFLKNLCYDCKKRFEKNTLRLLDCKNESCEKYKSGAPQIIDFLDNDDQNHFREVLEYLDELEIPYELNTYLVRGLDYYTRTVFEIWPKYEYIKNPSQFSLGGGGRYDNLVELLGGKPTPGVGFALGIERIIEILKKQEIKIPGRDIPDVFIVQLGKTAKKKSLKLIEALRQEGFKVISALGKESIKSQLKMADKFKVPISLILGQKEVLDGTAILRDMSGGMQEFVSLENIVDEIKRRLPKES